MVEGDHAAPPCRLGQSSSSSSSFGDAETESLLILKKKEDMQRTSRTNSIARSVAVRRRKTTAPDEIDAHAHHQRVSAADGALPPILPSEQTDVAADASSSRPIPPSLLVKKERVSDGFGKDDHGHDHHDHICGASSHGIAEFSRLASKSLAVTRMIRTITWAFGAVAVTAVVVFVAVLA